MEKEMSDFHAGLAMILYVFTVVTARFQPLFLTIVFCPEKKQRAKVADRLDKCVKEKLLDFCDVLNIPVFETTVNKEELSVTLLEFLESPNATTYILLAEKD
ncbi:DEK domain-containing chromatin-associated protein 1-like [Henckelia pumila]|uniref:DEK domain-containing chromatin-associated protein 1-like n=1 Tax=Henckelia pumila TaxID=405737 RepID=UPI003C6E9FDA